MYFALTIIFVNIILIFLVLVFVFVLDDDDDDDDDDDADDEFDFFTTFSQVGQEKNRWPTLISTLAVHKTCLLIKSLFKGTHSHRQLSYGFSSTGRSIENVCHSKLGFVPRFYYLSYPHLIYLC